MSESFFSSFYLHKQHKVLKLDLPRKAYLQYKHFRLDLLSGHKSDHDVNDFFTALNKMKINQDFKKPVVVHFMFELGYSCVELDVKADENIPLAIYIEYDRDSVCPIDQPQTKPIGFTSLSQNSFEDYEERFNKVYQALLRGDSYQLNLTHPFYLKPDEMLSPVEFQNRLWQDPSKVGPYAHSTYIEALEKLFISNSPECLFQVEEKQDKFRILTMPIKGTEKVRSNNYRDSWKSLKSSSKNQAELFMISDLMRNDLTKLTGYPARVRHDKFPLKVPGLIHQFSVIDSELPKNVSIFDIIKNLFPGGSITGAPKKNTLRLIQEIEDYRRGFYCGSTLLLFQNIKTASINIRSAEINYGSDEIKYGAGGGVTLLSEANQEFDESLNKLKSFLMLFDLKKSYN